MSHNTNMKQRPLQQKTIGILGGMSNRATVEYYNFINEAVNKRLGGWDIAQIVIVSCNFGDIEYFVRNNEWEQAEDYLLKKAKRAESAGVDVLICMSNTMHKVLSGLDQHIQIPFIHIATPTANKIVQKGLNKVALLGTKPVMADDFMVNAYANHGLELLVPEDDEQVRIDEIIFDELVKNIIKPESKQYYMDVCHKLIENGAEGIILGCTEIFLLIDQSDFKQAIFNTTELHVNAVVDFALDA